MRKLNRQGRRKIFSVMLSFLFVLLLLPQPGIAAPAVPVIIEGVKAVMGSDAPAGTRFDFTLTQVEADGSAYNGPSGISLGTSVTTTARGPRNYPFSFAAVALEPGTYYFKVQEVNAGGSDWTYDAAPRYIKVTVSEAGKVTLGDAKASGQTSGSTGATRWFILINTAILVLCTRLASDGLII